VVEIKPNGEWYDFEAKYLKKDTTYVCPADLDTDIDISY
jgi:D-alanine-D-alanine ligase-like ATP-grasp enzyme